MTAAVRIGALVSMAIGLLVSALYAAQSDSFAQFFSVIGVSLTVAAASLLIGGLLGFLFGIPRTLQQGNGAGSPRGPGENQPPDTVQSASYQPNTNLEQISDWLTKILVGVGLTQITSLPKALRTYAQYASPGLGGYPNSEIFALALLVYFLVCGFLISYLLTRLNLAGAFVQADLATRGELVQVNIAVSQLQKQRGLDDKARSVVLHQLNLERDAPQDSQEVINEAIRQASPDTRVEIFYLAQTIRRENWQDPQNKYKMENTIPIFRGLIASDPEDRYHKNHGQLGFALKDKTDPDWAEAEAELTRAIQIRNLQGDYDWQFYELNRAICRINLDLNFQNGQAASEGAKRAIELDLQTAEEVPTLQEIVFRDPTIVRWRQLNPGP